MEIIKIEKESEWVSEGSSWGGACNRTQADSDPVSNESIRKCRWGIAAYPDNCIQFSHGNLLSPLHCTGHLLLMLLIQINCQQKHVNSTSSLRAVIMRQNCQRLRINVTDPNRSRFVGCSFNYDDCGWLLTFCVSIPMQIFKNERWFCGWSPNNKFHCCTPKNLLSRPNCYSFVVVVVAVLFLLFFFYPLPSWN